MKIRTEVLKKLGLGVIYLLLEPDSFAVRYVGQTTRNPRERLSGHMSKEKTTHKRNWIESLGGRKPRMLVYRVVPVAKLDRVEIETIARFRGLGCSLVNCLDGGRSLSVADRQRISIRQQGEGNSGAKLTAPQVLAMYECYAQSDVSQKQLAEINRCDIQVINRILRGKGWNHLWRELSAETRHAIENKRSARNTRGLSRLSRNVVLGIYNAYAFGGYSMKRLSREHGRALKTMRDILKGETYKDVYSSLSEETKRTMALRVANWRQRAGRPKKPRTEQK